MLAACQGGEADSETADTSTGSSTHADTTTAGDTDESGTTEAPWQPGLARGLTLTHVEANQGVTVEIGRDGEVVPGEERAAYLLAGRRTVIRGYWDLPDDWEPRELEARLDLFYPDGHHTQLTQVRLIDEVAFAGNLKRSFFFGIEADDVVPGMRYRFSVWETVPGYDDLPEPAVANQIPQDPDGDVPLGIEASDQALEIIVVPFTYNADGCQHSPDTSPERIERLTELMFQMNPIDRLDITVTDPVEWTTPLESFAPLNEYMSVQRFENGDPPHVFYFGLVYPCNGSIGGFGGLAHGIPTIPPLADEAWMRVSTGIDLANDVDWTGGTFVHEVGHTQGRLHVNGGCGAAGTDPSYPEPNGGLGTWGFGILDLQLRHPTLFKDYMTYCHPYWVSPWGWNKVYDVMRVITSWGNQNFPDDPYSGSLLIGSFDHLGNNSWYTVPGGLGMRPRSAVHHLSIEQDGVGTSISLPTAIVDMPDGGGYHVVGELPNDIGSITRATYIHGATTVEIPGARIARHDHKRSLRTARP